MSYSQRRSFSVFSRFHACLVLRARARHKHPIHVSARHARARNTHTHTHSLTCSSSFTHIRAHIHRRTADLFVFNGRSFAHFFSFFFSLNISTASFFVKIGFLARFLPSLMTHGSCLFIYTGRQAPQLDTLQCFSPAL